MSAHLWWEVGRFWSPWCFTPLRPANLCLRLTATECLRPECRDGELPSLIRKSDSHGTYRNPLRMRCWKPDLDNSLVTLSPGGILSIQNYIKEVSVQQLQPWPFLTLCHTNHQKSSKFGLLFRNSKKQHRPIASDGPSYQTPFLEGPIWVSPSS